MNSASRTPGQRAGLTHEQVIAAARGLIVEDGVDSLSMRSLARRLDVAPNAIYSHVANKTALIDELLDSLLGDVASPSPDVADPAAGLSDMMTATFEILVAHSGLVPMYLARQGARGPNARALGDSAITLLGRLGVHGSDADEALRVLIVYTIGFAAFATQSSPSTVDRVPVVEGLDQNFASGLGWLLAGIHPGSDPADRQRR